MFRTFAVTFVNSGRAHTFTARFSARCIAVLWDNIRDVRTTAKEYGYKITRIALTEQVKALWDC